MRKSLSYNPLFALIVIGFISLVLFGALRLLSKDIFTSLLSGFSSSVISNIATINTLSAGMAFGFLAMLHGFDRKLLIEMNSKIGKAVKGLVDINTVLMFASGLSALAWIALQVAWRGQENVGEGWPWAVAIIFSGNIGLIVLTLRTMLILNSMKRNITSPKPFDNQADQGTRSLDPPDLGPIRDSDVRYSDTKAQAG